VKFLNRVDSVNYTFGDGKSEDLRSQSMNLYRTRFGLNLNADLGSNLKFFSKLGARKVWNDMGNQGTNSVPFQETTLTSGEEIKLEKAYFDYTFMDNLTFSMGRLPTVEGGPYHLTLGQPVRGTYPRMAYANSLDGMGLSYRWNDFSVKVLTHAFGNYDREGNSGNQIEAMKKLDESGYVDGTNFNVYVLDYETRPSWATSFNASVVNFSLNNLMVPFGSSPFDSVAENGLTALTGAEHDSFNMNSEILVDFNLEKTTVYLEARNLMKSKVNVAFGWSTQKSLSNVISYTTTDLNESEAAALSASVNAALGTAAVNAQSADPATAAAGAAALAALGPTAGVLSGYLVEVDGEETSSTAMNLTVSYDLNAKNNFGINYFSGEANWGANDAALTEPFDIVGVPGTVTQVFYNNRLENNLTWTLGYIAKEVKYEGDDDIDAEATSSVVKATTAYTEFTLNM
jgi:hypothetical protein